MALIMECMSILALFLVSVVPGNGQTGTVVKLNTYNCETLAPKIKIDAKSAITVNIKATTARRSDSVSGQNLWRVGIFGSEWPGGSGVRHDYVEQILTERQASKPVERAGTLKLKNIRSRFNLSQIGCGPVAYFCVELAQNEQSTVDFELKLDDQIDNIVTCERLSCPRQYESARVPENGNALSDGSDGLTGRSMDTDLPPACLQQCPPPEQIGGPVCGNNSVQYDSFCEIHKATHCQGVPVKIAHPGECPPASSDKISLMLGAFRWDFAMISVCRDGRGEFSLNISVPVLGDSEAILDGERLWRVGLYGSSDPDGRSGEKLNYIPQLLGWRYILSTQDVVPSRDLVFSAQIRFDLTGIGCEDSVYKYLCVAIEKNPDAEPDFEIANRPDKRSMVSCERRHCLTPETMEPYIVAKELLRSGAPTSFVGWLLSAMTADSELDLNQFMSSLSSSNTEAPPGTVPSSL